MTLCPLTSNQVAWVLIWIVNNISVTLINKASFAMVNFRYPYTLSAIHMLVCTVGSFAFLRCAPTP